MFKKPATSLILFGLLSTAIPNMRAEIAVHNLNDIPYFSSTQEITNFFAKASVPIQTLDLHGLDATDFMLAAFPYSGVDTIDVFYFVKYGDGWKLKMLFFHLRPRQRQIEAKVIAESHRIVIYCRDQELLSIVTDVSINSPER